ncbi:MAG: hypothetical protein ACW97W_04640 [Candidatus Hodarchaeales archaeon]|jgi:hypothetical protein
MRSYLIKSTKNHLLNDFIKEWNSLVNKGQPITKCMLIKYNQFASNKDVFLIREKIAKDMHTIKDYSVLANNIGVNLLFSNTGKAGFYSVVKNWKKLISKLSFFNYEDSSFVYFTSWEVKSSIISQKGSTSQWSLYENITKILSDKERMEIIRKFNLVSKRNYHNFDVRILKYSVNDVSKVLEAKLHQKLITNDFTKHIRKTAKAKAEKLIDGTVTSALFLNEKFKIVTIELDSVLREAFQIIQSINTISDNKFRTLLNKKIIQNAKDLNTPNDIDILDADKIREFYPIANPDVKIKLHRTDFPRVWFETCEDSYQIALSKYLIQDSRIRKRLHLTETAIQPMYIGQGTRLNIISGHPDIITIDKNNFVHEVIQVKQIAITKPGDPIDLFRDLTKTFGFSDKLSVSRGMNVFFVRSTDVESLDGSHLAKGKNLIIMGHWKKGTSRETRRLCQVVEAVREIAKGNRSSDVSNQQLTNKVLPNLIKVKEMLHDRIHFKDNISMETLPSIDDDLLQIISSIADSTESVTDYYKMIIFLLGNYCSTVNLE